MSWILSGVIIGACAYIGIGVSLYYKKREGLFMEIGIFCNKLKNDINFSHKAVLEILNDTIPTFKSPLKDILSQYKKKILDGEFTNFSNLKIIKSAYLKQNETDIIIQFLSQLGKSDAQNQSAVITAFENNFKVFKDECYLEKKKYSALYIKLSLLIGVLICIILM